MSQLFKYQAYDASGAKQKGELRALDLADAQTKVEQLGLTPLSVSPVGQSILGQKNVKLSDIEQSTNQLSILLKNGLKVDKALSVLVKSSGSSPIAEVWSGILDEVKKGKELSSALEERNDLFNNMYCEMVRIGENTGNLPTIFSRLAESLKFQSDLKKKVTQAATYPGFIFLVCITAIFAIFNFIVPSMSSTFSAMEDVPSYTQFLLDASEFVQLYQIHMLVVLVLIIFSIMYALQNVEYRQKLIAYLITLPVIRGIAKQVDRIRFTTAIHLTLESGVSLSVALSLAAKTVVSKQLEKSLVNTGEQVATGSSLTKAIESVGLYDELALSLINVGEESGSLPNSFKEIASRSREQFESWLIRFTALLEPLLILIMGGIVGSVVVVMLLSIVSINDVAF